MRVVGLSLAAVLLVAGPTPAAAQRGSLPTLVFTIFGGTYTGHALWRVDRQPLCVGAVGASCTSQRDTLALGRAIGGGIAAGLGATYYQTPHLGFHGEIALINLTLDNSCTGIFFNPDTTQTNRQACDDFAGSSPPMSAVSIAAGLVLRVAPRSSLSPHLRAGIGILTRSRGTLESGGRFLYADGSVSERLFIVDDTPARTSFSGTVAVGFNASLGPGYQFRMEVSDVIASFQLVTGPANALGDAPAAARSYHHFGLTLGLGIVLEKRRGRRY